MECRDETGSQEDQVTSRTALADLDRYVSFWLPVLPPPMAVDRVQYRSETDVQGFDSLLRRLRCVHRPRHRPAHRIRTSIDSGWTRLALAETIGKKGRLFVAGNELQGKGFRLSRHHTCSFCNRHPRRSHFSNRGAPGPRVVCRAGCWSSVLVPPFLCL